MIKKLSSNFLLQYRTLLSQAPTILVKSQVNLSFKVIGVGTTHSDKPPIFLLHGLLGCKKNWKGIGKTITNLTKRTVVLVDVRNHGDSPHVNSNRYDEMAGDLIQLLEKLEVKRASIVGHDIGGRMAMCTSLIAPERVAGLLIVDISPVSTSEEMKNMLKVLMAMKAMDFKAPRNLSHAKKEAKTRLKHLVDEDILLCNVKVKNDSTIGWSCNIDSFIKNFKQLISFPKSLMRKKYHGPCLFIGGQLSEYLPADDLTKIRDIFPSAVIKYIPKAGHNLHAQDTWSFLELAIAFLKSNH